MSRPITSAGWRLCLALPDDLGALQKQFIDLITTAAEGRAVPPMRRSRHAVTFNVRLHRDGNPPLSLFVKVLDSPSGLDWLKQKLRGSTVSRVSRITEALLEAGFEAPAVWAYGEDLSRTRELIVTPRAIGDGPLRALAAIDTAGKRLLLSALGREIARLHRAGFVHGDLTPFNIFIVTNGSRFIFLDHERTRRIRSAHGRAQLRNLVQLGRFELPGITRTDRLRLLRGYTGKMEAQRRQRVEIRVAKMLSRRIRRDGGLERIAPLSKLATKWPNPVTD